jgi:hypothetical protein
MMKVMVDQGLDGSKAPQFPPPPRTGPEVKIVQVGLGPQGLSQSLHGHSCRGP